MNTFFQTLTFWHWLGLGVLLGIADVVLGANFVLLWSGLAAIAVGLIMVLFPLTWEWQFILFGLGVFMSLAFWRYHLKKNPTVSDKPHLNQRASRYTGRVLYLEEPIVQGVGKAKIDDTIWKVRGEDCPEGTQVKVVAVEGMVLIVEKV